MKQSSGVIYICTGTYHEMLKNSLRSLRETNPELSVHVLSDRPLSIPFTWTESWIGKASRRIKTRLPDYSPFDLNLFVDTDTVFGESLDIAELLGNADLAMALDKCPNVEIGGSAFLNFPGFTTSGEVEETLSMCGPSFPFFNSGVMVWRDSVVVRAFFDRWHLEWLKYKRVDQLALARALCNMRIHVKTLDERYNYPVMSHRFERNKGIYHLIFKEDIARRSGLWNPQLDNLVDSTISASLASGNRAKNQYLHIGQKLFNDPSSSCLIVCPDKDECFWNYCTHNNLMFVVEGVSCQNAGNDNICSFKFESTVGIWAHKIDIPKAINRKFDYIIINGPKGFDATCPGREIPIAWAGQLARKGVFVFDYNRKWERELCCHYLGEPKTVIPPQGKGDSFLAEFVMCS